MRWNSMNNIAVKTFAMMGMFLYIPLEIGTMKYRKECYAVAGR